VRTPTEVRLEVAISHEFIFPPQVIYMKQYT
jgi:hypothetical protein